MIRHTATISQLAPFGPPRWRAECKTCGWAGAALERAEALAAARHHNDTAQPLEADEPTQSLADVDGARAERLFRFLTADLADIPARAASRARLEAALRGLARRNP